MSGIKSRLNHVLFINCQFELCCAQFFAALHPAPVQNLSVTVDENIPTITLSWNSPVNIQSADELNEYHIHVFRNEQKNGTPFRTSTTSFLLTRELGLDPLENYHFQVRAQCGREEGEWNQVSAYYGNTL